MNKNISKQMAYIAKAFCVTTAIYGSGLLLSYFIKISSTDGIICVAIFAWLSQEYNSYEDDDDEEE